MTNTNKLNAKIMESGLTQAKVAKMLGISCQSLSYKINNGVDFKATEINHLCKILNISNKDDYFFWRNSHNSYLRF